MSEKKTASNTIFLVRGDNDVVAVFRPTEENKTPKRALKAFIAAVHDDSEHELHEDLVEGNLSWMSGKLSTVAVKAVTEPVL